MRQGIESFDPDDATTYNTGGVLSSRPQWISFPEEVHVWTEADMARLRETLEALHLRMKLAAYAHTIPVDVF